MDDFQFERDAALRGFWVKGLQELQAIVHKAMLYKEEYEKEIFIPDTLLRELGYRERRGKNG